MVRVIDAFPFFGSANELDILEIRLNELDSVVDEFIIAEATKTHSGMDKPLNYKRAQARFSKFAHKINYIVVNDMPMTPAEIQAAITPQDRKWLDTGYQMGDNWVRERFQRNALMRGLNTCDADDIIIIEDADEIVKASLLKDIRRTIVDGSNAIGQEFRTCYMNWLCTNMEWYGSKILKRKFVYNPSEHRFHTPAAAVIANGGFHFNYWGGADAIREKIKAFAHQEFDIPEVLGNIEAHLQNCTDVLGRLYQYKIVPIDGTLPSYLVNNLPKFEQYIYRGA